MKKKIICCLLCLIFTFLLSGCWSYVGLDEITIVSGMAIDKDPKSNQYKLSFEIIDLTSSTKEKTTSTKVIESEGSTIFNAIRNAKKKLSNKLYFGHAKAVILSEYVAKDDELSHIIDFIIRNRECRENAFFMISQEKSAGEMLKLKGLDQSIISYEITDIISDDAHVTSSTNAIRLYNLYNILHYQGISPTLPAFHCIESIQNEQGDKGGTGEKKQSEEKGNKINELNGTAVFKNQKLIGYLSPEESKYFLFITNAIKGGIFSMSMPEKGIHDLALDIYKNKTNLSFKKQNDKIIIQIKVKVKSSLGEFDQNAEQLKAPNIEEIEKAASEQLKSRMEAVIKKVQTQYNSDIFGFGNAIYRKDPKLWSQLAPNWDVLFPQLEVVINPEFEIINTALFKL